VNRQEELDLATSERRYNHEGFSVALRGCTPGEMLAAKLAGRPIDHLMSIGAGA
jgi:hypothetical protein